jgi:cyclic pyranopterin phosphate synthase
MGRVEMVDISEKKDVVRIAKAEGFIRLKKDTIEAIKSGKVPKGDVLATANIAGILAVKKTPELIPMCHPIPITSVSIEFEVTDEGVKAVCTVKSVGKTGVEMEALTGVSVALLTIWDMVKALEKDETGNYPHTVIEYVRVVKKVKGSTSF